MFSKNLVVFVVVASLLTFVWYTDQAEAQYVKQGMVGYWPFDKDTIDGNTIEDLSGNANHGTINFPVKTVPGQVGDALEFDGENAHYVGTELMITEAHFESLTMMAWAKPAHVHEAYGQLMGGDDGGWDRGFGYRADTWEICVGRGGDWQPGLQADFGEWQHVVVIYTPTNTVFYKNGERHELGDRTTPTTSNNPFLIGDDIPCGPNCAFPGPVDEVLVYGRELTDAEVQQNYAAKGAAVDSAGKLPLAWGAIKAFR